MFSDNRHNKSLLWVLYIFCILTLKVLAKVAPAEEEILLNKYQYIPQRGFIVDMKDRRRLNFEEKIQAIDKAKTTSEKEKLNLFDTVKIPTPKLWVDQWKKEGSPLYKRYRRTIEVPNPNHNETVYQMLLMSGNAYVTHNSTDWIDLTEYGWDIVHPFGWNGNQNEKNARSIRGYIFENQRTRTLVVSIKGTSTKLFGFLGGPTSDFDKYNDNMMFSCCCAIVDLSWKGICDCHSGISNVCEATCLKRVSSTYDSSYYEQLKAIHEFVNEYRIEDGYKVYYTGHSLGGALASLSGLTTFSPSVTFESPGEAQFAERIGIKPPVEDYDKIPIYHFGNNGDPIFTGKCKGITSICYYSGYAMETKCHVGKTFMFDLDENHNGDNDNDGDTTPPEEGTPEDDPPASLKSQASSPFLINKSSVEEHQFQLDFDFDHEAEEDYHSAIRAPTMPLPSNPGKLNMLHHRMEFIIDLFKKWSGPWPAGTIQDPCVDCENWEFMEGDGDEGHT